MSINTRRFRSGSTITIPFLFAIHTYSKSGRSLLPVLFEAAFLYIITFLSASSYGIRIEEACYSDRYSGRINLLINTTCMYVDFLRLISFVDFHHCPGEAYISAAVVPLVL